MGRIYDNCQERNRCLVPTGNSTDLTQTEESLEDIFKELDYTVEVFMHQVNRLVKNLKSTTVGLIG